MPILCITCGKSMPDSADFCPFCGRAVVREMAGEPQARQEIRPPQPPASAPRAPEPDSLAPDAFAPRITSQEIQPIAPTQVSLPLSAEPTTPVEANSPPSRIAPPASSVPSTLRASGFPVRPATVAPSRIPRLPVNAAPAKRSGPLNIAGATPAAPPAAAPPVAFHDRALSAAAYFTFIPAVVFLLVKQYKRSKFVRFHAWQSVFFWILVAALLGVGLLASTFGFLLLWLVTGILVVVALALTWLVLSIKALQGEWFRLPGIGELAEQVGR